MSVGYNEKMPCHRPCCSVFHPSNKKQQPAPAAKGKVHASPLPETNSNQTPKNGWLEDYCWWFRNPAITTCDGVKTLLVIQDIYQRQLVIAGFIPTTVFVVCFRVSADFQGRFRCYYMECSDLKQPPTWRSSHDLDTWSSISMLCVPLT